jgi:uncharacterized membrane protein YfcA
MPDLPGVLSEPVSYPGLALIVGTVLLAGFLRGFVGFGAALVIVMVVSLVLGPLVAVPIASLTGLPAMFQLLPNAIRFSERSFVVPFGLATFLAAPLGTWVYRDWRPVRRPGPAVLLGAGAVAGLVQGSAGVGGPPAVAVALSRPGTAQQQRANVIGAVTALSLCSLIPLWYHGLFTRDVIVVSVALVPVYVGATWVGTRFFSLRGHRHYRNAALLTLAVIGVLTLALGGSEIRG